jgi:hypothetical protein
MKALYRLIYFLSTLFVVIANDAIAQSNGERIEEFVENLPRNSLQLPMYWLEMESVVGWERMILIFGYANNEPACSAILKFAAEDAPMRRFRCSEAN